MEVTRPFCCNDLKKKTVLDSAGKKIGKISDLTFTFDGMFPKYVCFQITNNPAET
ncbi:MAG: PRC-barrel domain-containing protein [Candidatus Sifarchaeia archaeon]